MQIVLLASLVPCPRRHSEIPLPVVRTHTVAVLVIFGRSPDVPVPLGVILGRSGLLEPLVLVRGVVDDQVEYDAHAAFVDLVDEVLAVLHRAVWPVDVFVVTDVVAHVHCYKIRIIYDKITSDLKPCMHTLGACEMRRDPDNVDAEIAQIIQLGNYAL